MALFGKKKPAEYCAICGKERKTGLLRGLFQTELDGQYVCSDCFGGADVQDTFRQSMSLADLKGYYAFREENQKLKDSFQVTDTAELATWGDKIVFDNAKGLMCCDENLGKTIFQRDQLRSFVIREDQNAIFEGSAEGLNRYESAVPELIHSVEHEIEFYNRRRRMYEDRLRSMSPEQRAEEERNEPCLNVSEPVQYFYVELYFDHPYWNDIKFEVMGPRFNNSQPNAYQYLIEYRERFGVMEQTAQMLMNFAFPNAGATAAATGASQVDPADALVRFKELLDMGVITEEEFAAKKRQLLGL